MIRFLVRLVDALRLRLPLLRLYQRVPLPVRSRLGRLIDRHRRPRRVFYPVPMGTALAGVPVAGIPVTIVVVVGIGDGALERIVDEVAAVQLDTGGFRPLFVTDTDDFTPFRRHGYLFEHVMAADDWAAVHDRSRWEAYVADRLAALQRVYDADVVVTPDADSAAADLRALLP